MFSYFLLLTPCLRLLAKVYLHDIKCLLRWLCMMFSKYPKNSPLRPVTRGTILMLYFVYLNFFEIFITNSRSIDIAIDRSISHFLIYIPAESSRTNLLAFFLKAESLLLTLYCNLQFTGKGLAIEI